MIGQLAADWRFRRDPPADAATNMAADCALLDEAREHGIATFRVYEWSAPTLSFGRNERASGRYDRARLAGAGIATVRRPTGGRALLHHREVTYSVTAPLGTVGASAAYRAINGFLRGALHRLGVVVELAPPRGRALRPEGAACFAEPSAGELVLGDAKLVGSAQVVEQGAFLQHGSILLDDDQARIDAFRIGPSGVVPLAPVATLRHGLGRAVTADEVGTALESALRDAVTSVHVAESDMGSSASVRAHRVRFADPDWTWRR